jgi:hypothetical protein
VTGFENCDNKEFGEKNAYLVKKTVHVKLSQITKPTNMLSINGKLWDHSGSISHLREFHHIGAIIVNIFLFKRQIPFV